MKTYTKKCKNCKILINFTKEDIKKDVWDNREIECDCCDFTNCIFTRDTEEYE